MFGPHNLSVLNSKTYKWIFHNYDKDEGSTKLLFKVRANESRQQNRSEFCKVVNPIMIDTFASFFSCKFLIWK